ncbi:MAG: septal ring lytic transglycosylase RlpA family protein [Vampirovibrionales bacterium]|nr:septal ring lytic transglycosylase RlpA family protein [Vampirovibrionales bacterium]
MAVKNAPTEAGVYINDREVARFRSAFKGASALMRAKRMADGLYAHLSAQGDARAITPGLSGKTPVLRAGKADLAELDAQSAKLARQADERQLALIWANQIRQALGAPAISHGMPIASRSLITREETRTPVATSKAVSLDKFSASGGARLGSGMASWYGPGFHGRRCADGTRFDMNQLTAAHRSLPFGTLVRVRNTRTGKSVVVRVSDRGPFIAGRILDVSRGAAVALGMLGSGVAPVSIESVGKLSASVWRAATQNAGSASVARTSVKTAAPLALKVSPAPAIQPQLEVDARAVAQLAQASVPAAAAQPVIAPSPEEEVIVTPAVEDIPARDLNAKPPKGLELQPLAPQQAAPPTSSSQPDPASHVGDPLTLWMDELTPMEKAAANL